MPAMNRRGRSAKCRFGLVAAGLVALWASGNVAPASAQSLKEAMRRTAEADTLVGPPPAPWTVVAGEVLLGTALAAAAGYATGLLGETVCDACDASEPGGDTPGLATGVPVGAFFGVWVVGSLAPPRGRFLDTATGALVGAAVFAGFTELVAEGQRGLRWSGIVLPAAVATMGFNRSRMEMTIESAERGRPPGIRVELALLRMRF